MELGVSLCVYLRCMFINFNLNTLILLLCSTLRSLSLIMSILRPADSENESTCFRGAMVLTSVQQWLVALAATKLVIDRGFYRQ